MTDPEPHALARGGYVASARPWALFDLTATDPARAAQP
jgi:hypothetical protein